jgi:Predicted RNA-binding protein
MDFIEISAKTVEDAITKACIEMETSSDNLDIQVVSEGTSGFLGLGSKDAVIKATRKASIELEEDIKKVVKKKEKAPARAAAPAKAKAAKKEVKKESKRENVTAAPKKEREERHREPPVVYSDEEVEQIKSLSQDFLTKIFGAMEMPVDMKVDYDNKEANLNIDFTGEEMGILIGKRGQTLDSLQYLTSLVVNKGREGYIRVKLDTENYRNRRKDTLESLARNIAYKVKKTRRPVALEPMNPYERRIIHSSLQGNKFVETYSEGGEPYRHVVITLKK